MAVRDGRISIGSASRNDASGGRAELAGKAGKPRWRKPNKKNGIKRMPVTNSGKPTTAREKTLIVPSTGLFSFKPAIDPKVTASGTEITRVTNASIRELPSRSMTSGKNRDLGLKANPQSPEGKRDP